MQLLKRLFMRKLERDYVSELDRFLNDLNEKYSEQSASQRQVIKKYQRLIKLRDNKQQKEKTDTLWNKF